MTEEHLKRCMNTLCLIIRKRIETRDGPRADWPFSVMWNEATAEERKLIAHFMMADATEKDDFQWIG